MKTIVGTFSALAVSLLLLSGFVSALTADQILKDSKQKLESLKDFSADFTYSIESPNVKPIAKSGALKYKKGMYVVDLEDQAIYCDSKTLWIYVKDEEMPEVNIMAYDPEEGMNIESIFALYEASSESRLDGEEVVHGQNCYKIFLAIKDASLDYNRAMVWINKRTKMLEMAALTNRRQAVTTYEFKNIKTNTGYTNETFQLDLAKLPKSVEVFDER